MIFNKTLTYSFIQTSKIFIILESGMRKVLNLEGHLVTKLVEIFAKERRIKSMDCSNNLVSQFYNYIIYLL